MNWLLWKEYRVNRVIVIVGATILIAPHLVALFVAWWRIAHGIDSPAEEQFARGMAASSIYSVIFSQLTLCLLGGHAIAGERADRSAEFLASLPISRTKIVAGKLGLAFLIAVSIWITNLLILWFFIPGLFSAAFLRADGFTGFHQLIAGTAVIGFLFFSVAWLFSSMWESSTFAVCMGLITPFALSLIVAASAWMLGYPLDEHVLLEKDLMRWFWGICLVLAPLCLVSGTWYYLRRVEP